MTGAANPAPTPGDAGARLTAIQRIVLQDLRDGSELGYEHGNWWMIPRDADAPWLRVHEATLWALVRRGYLSHSAPKLTDAGLRAIETGAAATGGGAGR